MKAVTVIPLNPMEMHRSGRIGWLRAAVLGSDDAIVSTASLMIGVAAASASKGPSWSPVWQGMVAGAMSMAVGEYVSVSSQRDAEQADIGLETHELASEPEAELQELATIYVKRGLEKELAMKVAEQLSAHDRLGAHMRDELGIDQDIPCASVASGVDFGRQLCVLRTIVQLLLCWSHQRGIAYSHDRRFLCLVSLAAGCVWRSPRRRAALDVAPRYESPSAAP
jgi:VIT1/CCC1 family predicted Fe2+/Mn2+ transporter